MNRGPKLQRISEHVWILPFNSPKDRPNLGYILGDEKALAVDAGHSSSHVEDFYDAIRSEALPLPQSEKTRFLFGCETDMDRYCTIGVSPAVARELDFIIVPTTHLHMDGFTLDGREGADERAALWSSRFDALLDADLPFEKVGVAHLTCSLIWRNRYLEVLERIPEEEYHRLFEKAAKRGIGIELNFPAQHMDAECARLTLLPYRIAKEEGCRFYLGSDAHHPAGLAAAKANFETIVDLLDLTEDDKIPFLTEHR